MNFNSKNKLFEFYKSLSSTCVVLVRIKTTLLIKNQRFIIKKHFIFGYFLSLNLSLLDKSNKSMLKQKKTTIIRDIFT